LGHLSSFPFGGIGSSLIEKIGDGIAIQMHRICNLLINHWTDFGVIQGHCVGAAFDLRLKRRTEAASITSKREYKDHPAS
jgi:hypothetical protein